jgi:hypothetical protein
MFPNVLTLFFTINELMWAGAPLYVNYIQYKLTFLGKEYKTNYNAIGEYLKKVQTDHFIF